MSKEHDICTIKPLTSQSRRVSLHKEGGQREDINSHVRSLVLNDKTMQRSIRDLEPVISVLSERAQGM